MAVEMRRKAGIAFGACAVLMLGTVAGVTAWVTGGDQTVGTWHEPVIARTPVSAELAQQAGAGPAGAPPAAADRAAGTPIPEQTRPGAGPSTSRRHGPVESASAAADGRQRVGELLHVDRIL